jgi:thimet oligopeptidase
MSIIQSFITQEGRQHPGLSVVLANFPAPSEGRSALLTLDDVRTFFHEFGHALHALLGATTIPSLSGTNTKRDFVELPSQLLEEWLWDKAILQRVSCHYQTGQSLSDELIDKIISLQHFVIGYWMQRQAYLAKLALAYYTEQSPVDLHGTMHNLFNRIITHVAYCPEFHFYASFGHLCGYGARYYGYLWSKVFAQDLFATIKQKGLVNRTVGKRYVDCILKPGGTQEPMELLERFLGRKPNSDAFFESIGLTK